MGGDLGGGLKYAASMTHSAPDDPADAQPKGLYDPPDEITPWFAAEPAPAAAETPPWRTPDAAQPVSAAPFAEAEARCAVELAYAAAELAALSERLTVMDAAGQGIRARLALIELEAMLWAQDQRLERTEIAHALMGRAPAQLPGVQMDIGWGFRRLTRDADPIEDLRAFLGLSRVTSGADPEHTTRAAGDELDLLLGQFRAELAQLRSCHPLTRGAATLWLWPRLGVSGSLLEAAVTGARLAARDAPGIGFTPIAPARRLWTAEAAPTAHLRDWLRAVRNGAQTARLELTRLLHWQERALEATAAIKGRNSERLIAALLARPMLLTEEAARLAGVSRDTAERQLARMEKLGVIREVTGARRFRIWAAA